MQVINDLQDCHTPLTTWTPAPGLSHLPPPHLEPLPVTLSPPQSSPSSRYPGFYPSVGVTAASLHSLGGQRTCAAPRGSPEHPGHLPPCSHCHTCHPLVTPRGCHEDRLWDTALTSPCDRDSICNTLYYKPFDVSSALGACSKIHLFTPKSL